MRALRIATVGIAALFVGFLTAYPAGAASVKSRLLSVTDMPPGWTVTYIPTSSGVTSSHCLSSLHKLIHQRSATIAFAGGETKLAEKIATGPRAVAQLHLLNRGLRACHGVTLKALGKRLHLAIRQMPFPKVGSTSAAYSFRGSLTGIALGLNVVTFRVGRYVGIMIYGGPGTPDITTTIAFAKEAVAKTEGQHVSPPPTAKRVATGVA
jgi:hypothetical protein